ncbi:MAG: hypothetical protein AB7P52_05155 [Alphaproteobacteria bacterium]
MTDQKKKRAAPISYRPPRKREAEFAARAEASGLSVNGFLNDCVFGKNRRRPGEQQALARLLGRAARIGDALEEISLTGDAGHAVVIEAALAELSEIRAALLALMGRQS